MDQFLKRRNVPKLTQEQINNFNIPISILKIKLIMNNLTKQRALDTPGFRFTVKFLPNVWGFLFWFGFWWHWGLNSGTLPNA
jgi:hypothetical protein